jgi:putative tryptophan/tyrosine transport system substrate-binding protein
VKRRELLIALGGGAIIAWPLVARAQQKTVPVIGYLTSTSPVPTTVAAFRLGLSDAGYVEGQNVMIEYRSADGHYDQLPALAADLVGRKVDLILAAGGIVSAQAAKSATSTIPIVFLIGTDPVEEGLVASYARPGTNMTGITLLISDLNAKRLQLLSELVPHAGTIALLVDPVSSTERAVRDVREAATAKGLQLVVLKASTASQIDAAFGLLVQQRAGALFVSAAPFLDTRREQILALAVQHATPALYTWRDYTAAGGLASYGASLTAVGRQLGTYAGRILNGTKPGDLPVQQSTKFELAINLKTAGTLGLTVPQTLLVSADEVIE